VLPIRISVAVTPGISAARNIAGAAGISPAAAAPVSKVLLRIMVLDSL
jgi:hypothetical protein